MKLPQRFIRKHNFKRSAVEQNDTALKQPAIQEGSAETTRGHGSQLESYCPSARDETQELLLTLYLKLEKVT